MFFCGGKCLVDWILTEQKEIKENKILRIVGKNWQQNRADVILEARTKKYIKQMTSRFISSQMLKPTHKQNLGSI